MPQAAINLAQWIQGAWVMNIVEPFADSLEEANFVIQFISAWITSGLVIPDSSSQTLSQPDGVPLYPIDIILSSFTMIAPTFNFVADDNSANL